MKRKTNLDYYSELLDELEAHFGRDWLLSEAGKTRSSHWVPPAWASARGWLRQASDTKVAEVSLSDVAPFDLASDLRIASALPNFGAAITLRRLRDAREIDKVAYEVHVAALSTKCADDVRFVPPSAATGERTPDLALTLSGVDVRIECKRRDKYQEMTGSGALWEAIEAALEPLHDALPCDYQVIVCAADDLEDAAIESVAACVRDIVLRGGEGRFSGGADGCVLLIRRSPPRPPGAVGAWIPANLNPAAARTTVRMSPDRTVVYGPMLLTSLYILEAHKLAQIIGSFDSARRQLPLGGAGLIYIDVDATSVPLPDRELYFDALRSGIMRELTPTRNTRIVAVVLTSGPEDVEIVDRGFFRTRHRMMIVRNPHHPHGARLRLPGEQ